LLGSVTKKTEKRGKELKLREFENRMLRKIFGPKRDEVTGGLRKLHNEEPHNLYSSSNIIRMITSRKVRWTERVAVMCAKTHAYRGLVPKP
jgi:hypothetical protein